MITNLSPYGQHAWHVVAYHRYRFLNTKPEKDHCSHVLLYLVELIDIALLYGDYEAAALFVDMLFDYRERCVNGVRS